MRHRLLIVVSSCLVLLFVFAGQRAAGVDASWPAAFSTSRDTPASAAVPALPDRAACAPDAGSWQIERVDATKDFGAQGSRTLALDAAGRPHIVYGGDRLYYAWYDGTIWHREVVDPTIGTGAYASLALDASGHPHVSYYDDFLNDLKYAYFDGTLWTIQTVDPDLADS